MTEPGPRSTFRGLPLTSGQDAECVTTSSRASGAANRGTPPSYAPCCTTCSKPPGEDSLEDEGARFVSDETRSAAERAMTSIEDEMDPIEASEEWHAAMDAENMKGPRI